MLSSITRLQRIWNEVELYEWRYRGGGMNEEDYQIRRLIPREYFRLQGMKDEDFDKIENEISDTQLYKIAGNGLTVDVMSAILKEMF